MNAAWKTCRQIRGGLCRKSAVQEVDWIRISGKILSE